MSTGEVMIDANQELTPTVISKLIEAGIETSKTDDRLDLQADYVGNRARMSLIQQEDAPKASPPHPASTPSPGVNFR